MPPHIINVYLNQSMMPNYELMKGMNKALKARKHYVMTNEKFDRDNFIA